MTNLLLAIWTLGTAAVAAALVAPQALLWARVVDQLALVLGK
jgi:hypothetical protein